MKPPPNSPHDALRAVLDQYAGAADADTDLRGNLTHIEVVPGVKNLGPVHSQQEFVRHELYPNLGSAGGRTTNDDSAASELEDK